MFRVTRWSIPGGEGLTYAHGKRVAEIKGYVRGEPKAFIATLEQPLRR